jgi:pyrroloquinoline-quinone synthase
MDAQQFLKQLEREIETHESVHHPFLKRFSTEPLTIHQIQTFGLQHYQLVKVFVNYMTNLLPRIPDREAAVLFRHVFDDEFGAVSGRPATAGQATIFRSHPALYRNFLRSLGLADEDWGKVPHLPEVSSYIEEHMIMTRDEDFRVGLGAIGPGHEFSIPIMFSYLVKGFRNNTTLSDEAIEYFTLHIVEDEDHAEIFNQLILKHSKTVEDQQKVREGVLRSLAVRKAFWDGLERAVFEPVKAVL